MNDEWQVLKLECPLMFLFNKQAVGVEQKDWGNYLDENNWITKLESQDLFLKATQKHKKQKTMFSMSNRTPKIV